MTGIINYPPVGKCIYCGSTPKTLTREHIIPRGLKGTLILPKSSCRECAKITCQIETMCLRHMMGRFRRRVGFKSRKPQPNSLPLAIIAADGTSKTHSVPIAKLPASIALPAWDQPPLLLTGENRPFQLHAWSWVKHDAWKTVEGLGGTGFHAGSIHPLFFSRMIAKIAHSDAIANYGLTAFKPLLLELILKGVKNPTTLIGGPPKHPPAEQALHRITRSHVTAHGKTYLLSEVRLLAQLGAPSYLVLVGEF